MRAPRLSAALALLLSGAACGPTGPTPAPRAVDAQPAPSTTSPGPGTPIPISGFTGPPAIVVRGGGNELSLSPWTTCWHSGSVGGCADGRPPETPPDIGSPPDIEVAFDTPGWRFSATAVPTGQACGGRSQSVDLPATGPTTHRLVPIGRAGDYTITINGRSTEATTNPGDVVTTFRWRTTKDGLNQAPSATMSLMATPPEMRASMGAELSARALGVSTNAGTVEARAVVTTSTGATLAVAFEPAKVDCVPDGSVFLRSPADDGKAIAALGPAPYRYAVTLILNGTTYLGTGTWPQDAMHDCAPCTTLHFDPPLPAL
jgi:hypothetical protein